MYTSNDINEYIRRSIGLDITNEGIIRDQDNFQYLHYRNKILSMNNTKDEILFNPSEDVDLLNELLRYQLYKLYCIGEISKSIFIEIYHNQNIRIMIKNRKGKILESNWYNKKSNAYIDIILRLGNTEQDTIDSLLC